MNKLSLVLVSTTAAVFLVWLLVQYSNQQMVSVVPPSPLFKDVTASIEDRIENLLSYMTLDEKIGQMTLVEKNSLKDISDISQYGLGALLSGFGGKPENNTIDGWKEMVEGFKVEAIKSRLGIPIFYGVDAIHGHSNVPGFVVFPHAIGLGATGDPDLVREVAVATRDQLLATGVNWNYSPTYDLPQDIRWGRVYETFSDDPTLTGVLGSAYIEGLQKNGKNEKYISVLATPKHFIGLGSMQWNTSSNENFKIDQGTTLADEAALRQIYLPPFKQAIDTGVMSIMVGLNKWGETKIAAESNLINKVLKEDLGFTGFVVSDWYGVYEITENDYDSAVIAINAGVDMVMLPFDYKAFVKNVRRAVSKGEITESRIDDAVRRILRAKFAAGLFDLELEKIVEINLIEQQALARKVVAESAVLLKNKNKLLPLSPSAKKLYVAGASADNVGLQAGAWTIEWQGIDGNWLPESTSILAGIKSVASANTEIIYSAEAEFGSNTEKADIGIAVVGEKPYAEGWGDNPNPSLSAEDLDLIDRLKLVSNKVVVVLVTGRPLIITEQLESWDGLMVVWLPGSAGAGVADVLFGRKAFTGKLPMPWPANIKQLPIGTDGKTSDGSEVLFERYFGLRY